MQELKKTFKFGDHEVTLATGRIARQADAAVMVTMADTVVLVTVFVGPVLPQRDPRSRQQV